MGTLSKETAQKFDKALAARLDDQTLTSIIDSVVKKATGGDAESLTTLVKILELRGSVACW